MGKYYRGNCQVSIGRRELVNRNVDAALAVVKHIDILADDEWAIAEPYLKSEEHYSVGEGENVSKVSYLGYDPSEEGLTTFLQSGVALYYALGACTTTGTSYGSPVTGTVSSGQGTKILTLSAGGMTPDAYIGDQLQITSGTESGNFYTITDNDATTVTVEDTTGATLNTNGYEITTAPFTHVITEARERPTFPMHIEQELTSQDIRKDLLGVLMKTYAMTIEVDADAMQDWGIGVQKSVAGSDLAKPTDNTVELYNWCHLKSPGAFTFSYNSLNPITSDYVDSLTLEVTNNSEQYKTLSNCWANKVKQGTREYIIKMHWYPENLVMYNLRNTKHTAYLTDMAFTYKLARSATDYINVAFDKLRLTGYPNKIPSKDDNEVGLDMEFRIAPGNTPTGTVMDALNGSYYERQTVA